VAEQLTEVTWPAEEVTEINWPGKQLTQMNLLAEVLNCLAK